MRARQKEDGPGAPNKDKERQKIPSCHSRGAPCSLKVNKFKKLISNLFPKCSVI